MVEDRGETEGGRGWTRYSVTEFGDFVVEERAKERGERW